MNKRTARHSLSGALALGCFFAAVFLIFIFTIDAAEPFFAGDGLPSVDFQKFFLAKPEKENDTCFQIY